MHYADRANILAVKLLLRQRRLSLPVDPFCLECGGKVVVDSVQHFSGVVGMKPQDFLCEQSEDCFAVLYRGRHFILYNRSVLSLSRRRWSIAHELGHICCRHQSDGPAQEAEANAFAASLLAPTVVVCELQRRGTIRQMQDLCDLFGLSMQAAQYRWEELRQRQLHLPQPVYFSQLELTLLERFLPLVEERLHESIVTVPRGRMEPPPLVL